MGNSGRHGRQPKGTGTANGTTRIYGGDPTAGTGPVPRAQYRKNKTNEQRRHKVGPKGTPPKAARTTRN